MVVYADVLFLINFISSYIMLCLLGKFIVKAKIKKIRFCIASAIGGISAAIIFSSEIPLLFSYLLRASSVLLMVFTAFYERKRQIVSQILWFLALSGMITGAMMLLTAFAGQTAGILIKSGIIYFNLPQKIFLLLFILSYIAVTFFMKSLQRRRSKKRYIINVTHNGRTVTVPALFDSGNLLKEPITGKCVSILEWSRARELLDADFELCDIGAHAEEIKLWAIPFNSLGKKSGIIFAFLADRVDVPEEKKVIEKTFIGLYGGSLSKNNEYSALLNAALL